MTKLEIQAAISSCLEKKPITLRDLLNETIKVSSYDIFMQELHLTVNTFKDIPEYSEAAQELISKMDTFINSCTINDNSTLMNHINNNLYSKLCGSSYSPQITLQAPFGISVNKSPESSINALRQIYEEFGSSGLKNYIELLKNPGNFTNYIDSKDKQLVAMHYLLYRTNHHSTTKLKRDLSISKLYQVMQENLSDSLSSITSEKEDFISFMNNEKQLFEKWFQDTEEKAEQLYNDSNAEYQNFLTESKASIEHIKETYSNELKLKKPAEFMKEKSEKYKESARNWSMATVALTIGLLFLLYLILDPHITFTEKIITINFFSNQMPVYSSVIIFSMIALVIYIIRLFIKMAVSSKHLSEEYYQKYSLTYFYLSLLFEGKLEQKQADVILVTLFTKADTGLLKNDSGSEIDLFTKLFSMMK